MARWLRRSPCRAWDTRRLGTPISGAGSFRTRTDEGSRSPDWIVQFRDRLPAARCRASRRGRRGILPVLVLSVDSKAAEDLEARVDWFLAMVVRPVPQRLAADRTEARTIRPAKCGDQSRQLDRLANQRLDIELVMLVQTGDVGFGRHVDWCA